MNKINSLIFIPDNVRYFNFNVSNEVDFGILSLEEKIKKDPSQRERLRCEAGIVETNKRRHKNVDILVNKNNNIELVEDESLFIGEYDDEDLVYLKNMTETEIVLDFFQNIPLGKGQRPPKPKTVKHFTAKWDFTEDQLKSPILIRPIKNGMLKWVTEAIYKREMMDIEKKEVLEKQRIDNIRRKADADRENNPHKDRAGLRRLGRLGSSGLEVREVGDSSVISMEGSVESGQTADGSVIHFDLGSDSGVRNPRSEMSEMEKLAADIGISGILEEGVDIENVSSMFSQPEYNGHEN
jgi:hypothetical protein